MPGFFVRKPLLTLYISTDKLSMLRGPLDQTQSILQGKSLDLLLLWHVCPQGQVQCVTWQHCLPSAWDWMGLMSGETWVHLLCVVLYVSKVWLFILREQTEHVLCCFCLLLESDSTFCIAPSGILSSTSFLSSMTSIALASKWWLYCLKMSCWLLRPKKTE